MLFHIGIYCYINLSLCVGKFSGGTMKQHALGFERALKRGKDIDNDFYNEEEIEHLLEDDEISSEEEAFMRGYIEFDEG